MTGAPTAGAPAAGATPGSATPAGATRASTTPAADRPDPAAVGTPDPAEGSAERPGPGPAPSPAPPRAGASWWRRRRAAVGLVVLLLAVALLSYALAGRPSARPLAPDNPRPDGARAAAQILQRQGVEVRPASALAEATRLAGPGTTLLVTDLRRLTPDQRADLVATGADLVLAGDPFTDLDGFDVPLSTSGAGSTEPVAARCPDPDARAAGRVSFTQGAVRAEGPGAVVCFPVGDDDAGAYAVWSGQGRTVRYLADPRLMMNEHLAADGNAALVLRALGQHRDLVWFQPPTAAPASGTGTAPPVPPAVLAAGAVFLAAAGLLALAQGRSLGPVVTEAMPVVVRAAETTRGRGRLYRRSRAHAHAGAALRAGTASRLARTLGLPRSAGPEPVVDAVARATGRDPAAVADALYGPPPADDAALLALSATLDDLESEVHR